MFEHVPRVPEPELPVLVAPPHERGPVRGHGHAVARRGPAEHRADERGAAAPAERAQALEAVQAVRGRARLAADAVPVGGAAEDELAGLAGATRGKGRGAGMLARAARARPSSPVDWKSDTSRED